MEKPLYLTENEAMSLLDMLLLAPVDLSTEQRSSFLKLSEHCRQYIREERAYRDEVANAGGSGPPALHSSGAPPSPREAVGGSRSH